MALTKQRFDKIIDLLFLISAFALVVGTPLIFTSLTRSVFEVNKLLLLRCVTLFTFATWFYKYLAYRNNNIEESGNLIKIGSVTWKKMGLEVPLLAWTILNIVSTIFSQNVRVSVIGAYDRWEGIITVINYILLIIMISKTITKRYQMTWVLGGIIGSTALSAFYGVFQSLGFDFMNWSQDPTFRVFACINNPVHFCAYVAMVVPLTLGTLLWYVEKQSSIDDTQDTNRPSRFSLFNWSLLVIALIMVKSFYFPSMDDLISYFIFSALLTITWLVAIHTSSSIPTKKEAAYWAVLGAILFVSILFNLFAFDRAQWFCYGISFISFFTLSPFPNKSICIKRLLFSLMILIFYTQLLSFSRATWVGFLMTMPFFYLLSSKHFAQGSSRTFMGDVIATAIGIFSFTLIQTFNIFHSSFKAGMTFVLVSSIAFIYTFFITRNELSDTLKIKQIISALISIAILLSLSFNYIQGYSILAAYALLAFFMFFATHLEGCYSRFVERFLLIVMFSHVQLSGRSLFDLTLHFSLGLTYFLIAQKGQKAIKRETKFWLLLFIFISGLAVMIPSIPSLLDQFSTFVLSNALFITLSLAGGLLLFGLFTLSLIWGTRLLRSRKFQVAYFIFSIALLSTVSIFHFIERSTKSPLDLANNQLAVAGTINKRSQSYGGQFENSARMSMWKSAIPWFKDYFIIGSGPDTVKYMYPVYRRSEYGLLEGGHNFTPDRLHNEYVNTLVTRGGLGFLIYYGAVVLGWLGIVLLWIYRNPNNSYRLISIGATVGGCIYLGQVLFNFGVVATLVMFYLLMGIGLAIRMHPEFQNEEN